MNLKFINRKQKLGISNPSDFAEWADKLDDEVVEQSDGVSRLVNHLLDYNGGGCLTVLPSNYIELNIHPIFNGLISELGLEFQHLDADDTTFAKAVQSIHADASKLDLYFNIIDLRPILELGSELNDIQLLDKMMVESGCDPIGEYWIEYSSEVGKKTLKTLFEYEVRPTFSKSLPYDENTLADQVLSHFDNNVRFYGNDCYAPWDGDKREITASIMQGKIKQGKPLQSSYETGFGLVIRDNQNIGFLLIAQDYD